MSDQKLFPEKLPDCIEEPAKALLQPVGETTGSTISNIMNLVFWPFTTASRLASGQQEYLIEKQKVKHAQQLEAYAKEIKEKLEKIPEEKRIEPDTRIVWDAFEKSRSALGVDEIRHLYATLIANAANSDLASQIHPSFSAIISQLSPIDVQNLEIIFRSNECGQAPIANFLQYENYKGDFIRVDTDVFLSNPYKQEIVPQAISLHSLARLQLITLDYMNRMSGEDAYSDIQAYYDQNFKGKYISEYGTKIEKGIAGVTMLGRAFLAVCRSPFDPISETSVEL